MKKLSLVVFSALALGACSSSGPKSDKHRGTILMKTPDGEAHIGLGSADVAVGDQVNLRRLECKTVRVGKARGEPARDCAQKVIATGTITKVYDASHSVAKFPADVSFTEDDSVEKTVSQTK